MQERENTNYRFLQLIYKKMLENDVNEKCADSIIGDIENSLKKESNIDSILAAVYQKVILKLGEPILLHYRKISQRLPFYRSDRCRKDNDDCKDCFQI